VYSCRVERDPVARFEGPAVRTLSLCHLQSFVSHSFGVLRLEKLGNPLPVGFSQRELDISSHAYQA
jgi:hypothetical protein